MKNTELAGVAIDWDRSILIQEPIDDELLKKLTPEILALRQKSDAPITIGIDSPGGSIATLESLLALLTGPTQEKKSGKIITVVTNRAFSAAASFLAFGSYAVALPHAKILYHDVRFGGMEDVTPAKAQDAAIALQDANDELALKLAPHVIRRLLWVYIECSKTFEKIKKDWPNRYGRFSKIVKTLAPSQDEHSVDLAAFATSLYAKLSRTNEGFIVSVMEQLGRWILMSKLIGDTHTYREKGSRRPGLLDGAKYLNKVLSGKAPSKSFLDLEPDIKLLVGLLSVRLASPEFKDGVDFWRLIEEVSRDIKLIESMNDPKNQRAANSLMLDHEFLFFGRKIKAELEGKSEEEKENILAVAAPHAKLLWCFCVLLCRDLFKGEHILSPRDAQLLGLVNEVAGGGAVQSFGEWKFNKVKEQKNADSTSHPTTKA